MSGRGDLSAPPGMRMRRAVPPDLEGILALIAACDETYRTWTPRGWEPPGPRIERGRWSARLEPGSPHRVEVAVEQDGRVVGLSSWLAAPWSEGREHEPGGLAHVSGLFVHPSRWRQGIAATLLDRAEAAMRAAGFARAQLWTPEDAPARAFYDAQGWTLEGRRIWLEELGLPLVGYTKALGP